jgi:hypothetical protein
MAHVEKKPRPLTELRPDLPEGILPVLERMMAKDPGHRYQTPAEVAAALAPFTAGSNPARQSASSQAAPAGEPNVLSDTDKDFCPAMTATIPGAPSAPFIGPAFHRPRRLRMMAAAVALVGGVVLLWALFARSCVPAPGGATEMRNVREVAKLRSADLLQSAQNTHALLRQVMKNKAEWNTRFTDITDLYNRLSDLWLELAGYGVGRDPYLDPIRLDDTGVGRVKPPPEFGIPGPYVEMGLPRLYERFLEASGVTGEAAEKRHSDFKKLVQDYSNPELYPHRAFSQRAYAEYRVGQQLFTPQYVADLKSLDLWLAQLETVLGKVPEYFEKAP